MARRKPEPRVGTDPAPGGLTHNPFAALRGSVPGSEPGTQARPGSGAPDGEAPGSPDAAPRGKIVVRRERKGRGGREVTLAEGPGLTGMDLELLAREAARALGCGARAEDGGLCVQGTPGARLVAFLEGRGLGPVVLGN